MSCVLRVTGPTEEVLAALRQQGLEAAGAANVMVSRADFEDFGGQMDDALQFLRRHQTRLRELRQSQGVDSLILDFGVRARDVPTLDELFPAPGELLRLAESLGVQLVITPYDIG